MADYIPSPADRELDRYKQLRGRQEAELKALGERYARRSLKRTARLLKLHDIQKANDGLELTGTVQADSDQLTLKLRAIGHAQASGKFSFGQPYKLRRTTVLVYSDSSLLGQVNYSNDTLLFGGGQQVDYYHSGAQSELSVDKRQFLELVSRGILEQIEAASISETADVVPDPERPLLPVVDSALAPAPAASVDRPTLET
jgi:hypothetical protein